jgi:UDP-N-acetylglucosamine--N-acetylmuramyl-(pentapeptide) pyrophosphoryl-undecaprenol N-acetylglucosamine transferase
MSESKAKYKFLIGAGGTGGHLYPAIAVVDALKKQLPNCEFYFCGRNDKIEAKVVPALNYNFIAVDIKGIGKLLSINTITALLSLQKARTFLKKKIKELDIDAVICTGAYISVPPGKAAKSCGIPLFLMESNVNPGKAIKMLSKDADRIFTSFDETSTYFPKSYAERIVTTGNPIRKEITNLPTRAESITKYGLSPDSKIILIFGGSLGAASINKAVEDNIIELSKYGQILWQTGQDYEIKSNVPDNVKTMKYIDDMASAYSAADLVVSRSGATTVAELCITAKPAILIPLKTASCNEQNHNANVLMERTGCAVIDNDEIGLKLVEIVKTYMTDDNLLADISNKLAALVNPNSADIIAKEIINFLDKKNGNS